MIQGHIDEGLLSGDSHEMKQMSECAILDCHGGYADTIHIKSREIIYQAPPEITVSVYTSKGEPGNEANYHKSCDYLEQNMRVATECQEW